MRSELIWEDCAWFSYPLGLHLGRQSGRQADRQTDRQTDRVLYYDEKLHVVRLVVHLDVVRGVNYFGKARAWLSHPL